MDQIKYFALTVRPINHVIRKGIILLRNKRLVVMWKKGWGTIGELVCLGSGRLRPIIICHLKNRNIVGDCFINQSPF
jgi:hypothetical protein